MTDAKVASIYRDINEAIQNQEYDEIPRQCDKVLELEPNDQDALKIKVVALIRLERYDGAVKVIDYIRSKNINIPGGFRFENAYCLFRLNKYEEAESILKQMKKSDRVQHLEAQIAFRREQFEQAQSVYDQMLARPVVSDDVNELKTNYMACKAALSFESSDLSLEKIQVDDPKTPYETLFNAATIHMANGNFEIAKELLVRSLDVCRTNLKDMEWTDEEIEQELPIIELQLACVEFSLGKIEQARIGFEKVAKSSADSRILAIAQANLALCDGNGSISSEGTAHLSLLRSRKLKRNILYSQKAQAAFNLSLAHYRLRQYNSAYRALQAYRKLYKRHADTNEQTLLLRIALAVSTGRPDIALDIYTTDYPKHFKSPQIEAVILGVQLHAMCGKTEKAEELIGQALKDALAANLETSQETIVGLGSLLAQLPSSKSENGRRDVAKIVDDIIDHVSRNGSSKTSVANALLRLGRTGQAATMYKETLDSSNEVERSFAGLVLSGESGIGWDSEGTQTTLDVSKPVGGENAQSLMGLGNKRIVGLLPEVKSAPSTHTGGSARTGKLTLAQRQAKRARAAARRLEGKPDSDKKPDPERWIPLKQRSYYRGSNRARRRQQRRGGTQGGAVSGGGVGGTGSANIPTKSETMAKSPSPEQEALVATAPTPASGGQKKKKKKKGTKF
ncbi:Srp72p [Mycoemilia scoparia]|uniref:Signal recognition particle subunit SRP72 n=1 Tax=Mycoemilia scoparia TaxID=417184 RepID=A0A9W8DVF6_9FUNG|nr:Srp72p [Mycoemilia scoparia]